MLVYRCTGSVYRHLAFGAIVFLICTLAGCGKHPQVTATMADDNTTITVPVGQELVILLDTNPSRNFLWVLDQLDQSVLEYKMKELVYLDQESKYGGNAFRKFTFTALKPGQTTLNIDLDSLEDDDEGMDMDAYWLTVVVTE